MKSNEFSEDDVPWPDLKLSDRSKKPSKFKDDDPGGWKADRKRYLIDELAAMNPWHSTGQL